jgi:hypothetical protein
VAPAALISRHQQSNLHPTAKSAPCNPERPNSNRATRAALRVQKFVSLQLRKRLDGLSRLLLSDAQVVQTLQIKPELRARTKEVREPQRGIAANRSGPVHDLRDPIGRHINFSRQFRRRSYQAPSIPPPDAPLDERE